MARVVLPLAVGPNMVISLEFRVESLEFMFLFFLQRYKKMHNAQCTMHIFL